MSCRTFLSTDESAGKGSWLRHPPYFSFRSALDTLSGRRAAQLQQGFEQMRHPLAGGRFHLQAQVGWLAVGAADAKLFHLEAAVMLHHLVEDVLHHVGVDQVALRFDDFL